jgi:exodeoxyribonuclease V gamma subunit
VIRLHYSNRIEELVGALAAALPALGDVEALFDGPWLVVPSRPLELYVDLELARRRGVSGNMDTLSIQGVFARLCARALPDVELIGRGHITGELLAALSDDSMKDEAALAPLQAYLFAAGPSTDAVDRRRVDVARALGGLFHDWSLTKPELLAAWRAGDRVPGEDARPLARAEHALWTALFGPHGRFARRGASAHRRYLTLDDVLAERLDTAWSPPPAIHVIGWAEIPRGIMPALSRLGERTDLAIYSVNPCREFWEDLNTARRPLATLGTGRKPPRARRASANADAGRQLEFSGLGPPGASPSSSRDFSQTVLPIPWPIPTPPAVATADERDPDNPFLGAWGHAGRQSMRLLNELSDQDFEAAFVDPLPRGGVGSAGGSLLAHLQHDMLDRRAPRGAADRLNLPADTSVEILGAPNPRRELESVAAEIWAMVHADVDGADDARVSGADAASAPAAPFRRAPMRFSDVAVLIAGDDEPYLSLARAVFREARDLPHCIVDQPIAGTSHLIEAVVALLALPLGTLTRREVLDVITHPNVRARFPDADPQVWLNLCEGLGIAHGADQAAFSDTYVDADVFNWDQGVKRLALGMFAGGPRGGVEDAVPLGGVDLAYVPAEVASEVRPDAAALALLIRSLLADARFARAAILTLPDWMRFVRTLMTAYVVPLTAADESARLRIFAALDELAAQAAPELTVRLGTALELVRAALTGLRGTRGQILGAGVAVGTLAALRSIPFRVVFVVGLGASRFPSSEHPSPLELEIDPRPDRRPAGEVTARQHDRFLFLEALLCARERLRLSYVDRDALTGTGCEPSSVVLEFRDHVEREYLGGTSSIERSVPLHRDEDPRVHAAFPGAALEARARALGVDLEAKVAQIGGLGTGAIVRALSPEARRALAPVLRTIDVRDAVARPWIDAPPPRARVLRLSDLRRFLECPLQGSARIFLGLRDLPDDTEAREADDEPFDVPRWLARGLLGDVLATAWRDAGLPDPDTLAFHYDASIARPRHGRVLPAGLFRDHVRRQHLTILQQWAQTLAARDPAPRGPARRICFGRPEPFSPPVERRNPIRIAVDTPGQGATTVEIHGTTEPQIAFGAGTGSLVLATSGNKDNNDKDSLRAFLDHVALAASLLEDERPMAFAGAVCRPGKDATPAALHTVSFGPLDRARARRYLTDLVGELLSGVHSALFPCEAVFRSWDSQMNLVDLIDQVRTDKYYRDHSSSAHGPVPEPFGYPTPSPELAERHANARFGLLRAERIEGRPEGKSKGAGKDKDRDKGKEKNKKAAPT